MQPVADDASTETLLANGLSAVHLGDTATAEQMLTSLAARAGGTGRGGAGTARGSRRGAARRRPAPAENAKSPRIMHHELAAMITLKAGQREQAVAFLKEAAADRRDACARPTAPPIR